MRFVAIIAAIALLATAVLGVGWFWVPIEDPVVPFITSFRANLHALSACGPGGTCQPMPLGQLGGAFPTLAMVVFWTTGATIVVIAVQAIARSRVIARVGYGVTAVSALAAVLAGYVLAPSPSDFADGVGAVHRSLAPAALLLGDIVALVALYASIRPRAAATRVDPDPDRLPSTPLTPHRMVAIEPPSKRPTRDT
jgi:hypothetical protein